MTVSEKNITRSIQGATNANTLSVGPGPVKCCEIQLLKYQFSSISHPKNALTCADTLNMNQALVEFSAQEYLKCKNEVDLGTLVSYYRYMDNTHNHPPNTLIQHRKYTLFYKDQSAKCPCRPTRRPRPVTSYDYISHNSAFLNFFKFKS